MQYPNINLRELTRISFENVFNWNALSGLQKKVIGVALSIILALSACCIYFACRRWKNEIVKNNKNDDKPIASFQEKAKNIAKKELPIASEIKEQQIILDASSNSLVQPDPVDIIKNFSSCDPVNVHYALDWYKNSPHNPLKKACEDFFKSIMNCPPKEFEIAFDCLKDEPEIFSLLVDAIIEDDNKFHPIFCRGMGNFPSCSALSLAIIERMCNGSIPWKKLFRTLSLCTEQQIETLTQNIVDKCKNPSEILLTMLVKINSGLSSTPIKFKAIKAIIKIALPVFQETEHLKALFEVVPLNFLNIDQIEQLIKHWHATLNQNEVLKKVLDLFDQRSPTPQLLEVCSRLGIDLKQLIESVKNDAKPQLWGIYSLFLLDSGDVAAITKIIVLIDRLEYKNSVSEKDERRLFGAHVAEHCQPHHIPSLFKCFLEDKKRGLIMDGFLLALLKSPTINSDLLKATFTAYWPSKKNFDQTRPLCSWKILALIQSEEMLKLIDEAAPMDQKEKIREYLKGTYSFGNVNYKLPLKQEIVNRVLG